MEFNTLHRATYSIQGQVARVFRTYHKYKYLAFARFFPQHADEKKGR